MVIEKFRNQNADAVYRRLREKGRMIPDGVTFEIVPVIEGKETAEALSRASQKI